MNRSMSAGSALAQISISRFTFCQWLTLCVVLLITNVAGSQELTVLRNAKQPYLLGPNLKLFVDRSHRLTIREIASDSVTREFRQAKSPIPNFSSTTSAIWVRFTVIDSTDEYGFWLLEVGYPMLDEVRLYAQSEDSSFSEAISSNAVPVEVREIRHRLHYFHLNLKKEIPTQYFLRITARTSIPISLTVRHVREFMDYDHNAQLTLGIFYGALLIMMLYNLFLFFSVRDRVYLLYVCYVISYTIYQLGSDGLSKEYLFTSGRDFFYWTYGGIAGFLFFGSLFTQVYLTTKQRTPKLDYILRSIDVLALLSLLFLPVLAGGQMDLIASVLGVSYIVTGMAAAIICRRQGYRPASYYLLAISGFFIGFLFRILRVDALAPMNFFTENAFQMGVLWEVTMLSLALGDRINTLKAEHARERELTRHRISSDLHDEIGSNLSSIAVSSQLMKRQTYLRKSEKEQLEDINTAARETAEAMRDIVWFINPEHDIPGQLCARMRQTAALLLRDVEVSFEMEDGCLKNVRELQARRNIHLIFKESLNNIVRHARATKVSIDVRSKSDFIYLCIRDNGIGFDPTQVKDGNGLKNIRSRAQQLKADLTIKSKINEGTEICLTYGIP